MNPHIRHIARSNEVNEPAHGNVSQKPGSTSIDDIKSAILVVCSAVLHQHASSEIGKSLAGWKAYGASNHGLLTDYRDTIRLCERTCNMTLSPEQALAVSAFTEYMLAELLEVSGFATCEQYGTVITPQHILIALSRDEELHRVFAGIPVMSGSVPGTSPTRGHDDDDTASFDRWFEEKCAREVSLAVDPRDGVHKFFDFSTYGEVCPMVQVDLACEMDQFDRAKLARESLRGEGKVLLMREYPELFNDQCSLDDLRSYGLSPIDDDTRHDLRKRYMQHSRITSQKFGRYNAKMRTPLLIVSVAYLELKRRMAQIDDDEEIVMTPEALLTLETVVRSYAIKMIAAASRIAMKTPQKTISQEVAELVEAEMQGHA